VYEADQRGSEGPGRCFDRPGNALLFIRALAGPGAQPTSIGAALSLPRAAFFAALLGVLAPATASAVEFRLDGFYRFRGEVYDTLSLDREAANSEGVRDFMSHRLRVIPHLRLNNNVHVYVDLDLMDVLKFGSNPEVLSAAGQTQATGELFDEPVALSQSSLPGSDYKESLVLRRAWAELYTPYVDFKVGRMGNHWGMGLLANDGNCSMTCDYGDTVDRLMISTSALDPVRISFAFDTRAEGFINRDDDAHSFLLTGGYMGEVHQVGAWLRWTRQPIHGLNLVHGDLYGRTKLGPLAMELEALILWGQASTTDIGVEELNILSGGGAFDAELAISPWAVGLQVGVATGDATPDDNTWNTFTMDRDHDIGLLMFEQPMPVFQFGDAATVENGNIDTSQALTAEGVSNAVYIQPRFKLDVRENLEVGVLAVVAFPMMPEAFGLTDPSVYGAEIDLHATWTLFGNFEIGGRAGFFIPGPVFEPYTDFAFGGEMRALVHF
jgi:hypothetical protein